jgi:hypothetical protein
MGTIKSLNGLLAANVKSVDGLAIANVKSVNGLDFASNVAPTDILLSRGGITEGYASGSVVGVLSSVDANVGDTFTYTLVSGTGDTDNASFTIDGANLKSAAVFAHDTKSVYSIRVRTTDSGSLYYEKALTVVVYCAPRSFADEYIARVRVETIDQSSTHSINEFPAYDDYSSLVTNMIIGTEYSIRVDNNLSSYYGVDRVTVWVDCNHDGDFGEANGTFSLTLHDSGTWFDGIITLPIGAFIGETRMRIRMNYDTAPDPCLESFSGGSVNDFSINVKSS